MHILSVVLSAPYKESAMKKNLPLILSAAVLLAVSGCRSGASPQLKRDMASMTAAQRDAVGRDVARRFRHEKASIENRDIRVKDISYRAADDTFVYSMVLKNYHDVRKVDPARRRQLEAVYRRDIRKETCHNRELRDLMVHGRYAIEYRIFTTNGKMLTAPARVTARDC
ncbi:hypothetical protein HMPREF9098_2508 [Kingella denitrificans ATCC 33394]|uniref:Uncharacterized protein n=2 Tax=Kingella denitrificans TaxID=502 RepID=F0F323_9NEIS|nr:hypothetical protein HMPREF9098_2508 [Kingella denitrificans ATCC 33394]